MTAATNTSDNSTLPENTERNIRADFLIYVRGNDYARFMRKLTVKPAKWWNLWGWIKHRRSHLPFRDMMEKVAIHGKPAIGLVVMRNMILADPDSAGAVLIIASTDVSQNGFIELHEAASRLEECRASSDPEIQRQMGVIFDDETYHPFRRRPVPECVGAPDHIHLYDESMRGDDFFEWKAGGQSIPMPWAFLFTVETEKSAVSAVVPGKMGLPALQHVIGAELTTPSSTELTEHDPNFRGLAWRMLAAYAITHASVAALLLMEAKTPPHIRENFTAASFALPSLALMWMIHRICWPLYRKTWFQKLASRIPLGFFVKLIPLVIPLAMVSSVIVVGGENVHPSGLWQLIALTGLYVGTLYGQRYLIRRARPY